MSSKYSQDTEQLNQYRRDWIDENEKMKTRTYAEWIDMYSSYRQHENKCAKIDYDDDKSWVEESGETYDEPFIIPYDNIYPSNPDTEEGKKYMRCLKEYIKDTKGSHKFNKPQSLGITPTQGYVGSQTIKRSEDVTTEPDEKWDNMITYLNESPPDIAEESIKRYLRTPLFSSMLKVHDQGGTPGKYIRIGGKWIKEEY